MLLQPEGHRRGAAVLLPHECRDVLLLRQLAANIGYCTSGHAASWLPTLVSTSIWWATITSVNAPGLASVVNGTLAGMLGSDRGTCVWGWPVLDPAPRPDDNWGITWPKLYEIEVMEMETADITEVGMGLAAACSLHQHHGWLAGGRAIGDKQP